MFERMDIMSEPVLYDIFNANCVEDIKMYKTMCSNTNRVLELGIGTGRIAIPLAQSGVNVVGIDNSAKMLATLKDKINIGKIKGISYYQQEMQSLALESIFDIIICPFCTFNFLLSIDEQEKTLLSVRKHMKDKSRIVFDLLTPNTFPGAFLGSSLKHFDSYLCPDEDAHIEIYTSSKFNQCNQIFSQERIFRKYDHDILTTELHTTMQNRLFFLGEFQLLLDKCGYEILNIYGDYRFSSFSQSSQGLIVVAVLK